VVLALLPGILHLYNLSETATLLAEKIVWAHGLLMIFIWPLAYTLPVTFRASGDAKFPMFVAGLSMLFCRIALAYLFSVNFHMGMLGTWLAMFIDWIVKAIIFGYRYFSSKWMQFKTI
jgi:Na+-driven multidrug efflux pump